MQQIIKHALLNPYVGQQTLAGLLRRIRDDMILLNQPQVLEHDLHPSIAKNLYGDLSDLHGTMLKAIPAARQLRITGELRIMRDSIRELGGALFVNLEAGYDQFAPAIKTSSATNWHLMEEAWVDGYVRFVTPLLQAQAANPRALGNGLQHITHLYAHGQPGGSRTRISSHAAPAYQSLTFDLAYLALGAELMAAGVNPDYTPKKADVIPTQIANWARFKRAYSRVHGIVNAA